MVVISMSLGVLYQAVTGATRNVGVAGEYLKATILAESLLNEFALPLETDVAQAGAFQSYSWSVTTLPGPLAQGNLATEDEGFTPGPLRLVSVVVSWPGGAADRQIQLSTVVPFIGVPQ